MKKTIKIMSIVSSILVLNACGYIDPRIIAINLTELPKNMKRKAECGPSQSITKPMAEAIVREINRLSLSQKIIKLNDMINLPYKLNCDKEDLSILGSEKEGFISTFKQVCHFSVDNFSYTIQLKYSANSEIVFLKEYSSIRMKFMKNNTSKLDFTTLLYIATRPVIRTGVWHRGKQWIIINMIKSYSKKTKGLCEYKRELRF